MHANFGNPRSRDRDLGILMPRKKDSFCIENLLFSYKLKTARRGMLKLEHRMSADKGFTLIEFGGARLHDRNFRG